MVAIALTSYNANSIIIDDIQVLSAVASTENFSYKKNWIGDLETSIEVGNLKFDRNIQYLF